MNEPRILVVDDEAFFREAIREVLEGDGRSCVLAATGREALELAGDPSLGVVVLDVQLPDQSGLEVFRVLQERRPELRVIVLSAHTDQETVLEALRLGAFDYLAKPIHDEELALAVRRAGETFGIAAAWTRLRARLRSLESVLERLAEAARGAEGEEREAAVASAAARAAAGLLRAERASLLLPTAGAPGTESERSLGTGQEWRAQRGDAEQGQEEGPEAPRQARRAQRAAGEGEVEGESASEREGVGLRLAGAYGFYAAEEAEGPKGAEGPEGAPLGVGGALAAQVLERGEPLLADEAESHPRRRGSPPAGRYRTGACALAPVPGEGGPRGVLCVSDPAEGAAFGEEDLALLRILAGQLAPHLVPPLAPAPPGPARSGRETASALESPEAAAEGLAREAGAAASALESAEPAALEAELARAVCDAVSAHVDPERLLGEALRAVGSLLGAAPVAIHLAEPAGAAGPAHPVHAEGSLRREAEWDGGRRSDRAVLPAGRGLTATVLETGALVASDAPAADPRFDAGVDTPEDGLAGPLLCGPLRFRGRVLGCFRAFPEKPERARPELGEILASALSAALRSVLLYRSLVDATEELATARRTSRS